jgi:hypothetical protein
VECIKVGPNDFKNMGQFEDDLYSMNPLSGNTKKYQLFYATMDNPGVLYAKESNEAVDVQEMSLKKGHDITREQILQDFDFQELPQLDDVEGIRRIKQVELFSKWRKHVPDEYKSPLYDNPGEDIIQSVKDDRKKKKQYQEDERRKLEAAEAQGILASQKSPVRKNSASKSRQKDNSKATTATTTTTTTTGGKRKASNTKKAPVKAKKQCGKSKKK